MPNKLKYSIEKGLYVDTGEYDARKTVTSSAAHNEGVFKRHRERVEKMRLDPEVRRYMSYISKGRKKPRWFYSGDMSIENGGYFYNLDNWPNYVDAWRVTPCSDAGGPDNLFWIEELTVNVDEKLGDTRVRNAFAACGWQDEKFSRRELRHRIVHAFVAYGYYDQTPSKALMVGTKPDEFWGGAAHFEIPEIEITLRSGTDLKKWLRKRLNGGLV
jgi:hypothetical protein